MILQRRRTGTDRAADQDELRLRTAAARDILMRMRITSLVLLTAALLAGVPAQAGLLARLLLRTEAERAPIVTRQGVKMLELEVVRRPARAVAAEFATLQFRIKQLSNPDPQFIGPPVRLRSFSSSGAQLEQLWLHPNGEGIYEASVSMRDSRFHYLYFETGNNKTVLAKVPWVVLRAAD